MELIRFVVNAGTDPADAGDGITEVCISGARGLCVWTVPHTVHV